MESLWPHLYKQNNYTLTGNIYILDNSIHPAGQMTVQHWARFCSRFLLFFSHHHHQVFVHRRHVVNRGVWFRPAQFVMRCLLLWNSAIQIQIDWLIDWHIDCPKWSQVEHIISYIVERVIYVTFTEKQMIIFWDLKKIRLINWFLQEN